jgi:hypothetical protein
MGFGHSVTDWPIGLTRYDPDKCSPGYTLFCPLASPAVYLMDITGEVVHMWLVGIGPGQRKTPHAKYLGGGHILYESDWLTEMDWKGNRGSEHEKAIGRGKAGRNAAGRAGPNWPSRVRAVPPRRARLSPADGRAGHRPGANTG